MPLKKKASEPKTTKAADRMPSMAWKPGNDRMDEDGSDEEEEIGSDEEVGSDGDDSQDSEEGGSDDSQGDDSGEDGMNEEEESGDDGESEDEDGVSELPNPVSVRERIDTNLEILSNFKAYRETLTKSRSEIVDELVRDLSEYYGYIEELAGFLMELFSPTECAEYMEASDRPRPLVIRTNTLKTTRKDLLEALTKRGTNCEMVEWSKVAIKVTDASVPIGATPEYLAGLYMVQAAASLNPVMALAPKPGERVLDMSAAPGGKTTYIAQLMKNSGAIIANDLKAERQRATAANLHRMGVKNAIICNYDGRKIPSIMKGFDRVLLDAPCSGLGVISKDQSVKIQRTVKDIQRIAHLQKELLCAAIDATDHKSSTGGIVVYSTCSISTEENEQVVNYVLKKRHVKLLDTGLEVGKPGFTRHKERRFHPSLSLTRRFYPHVHNMDGFYVAKFQKLQPGEKFVQDSDEEDEEGSDDSDDEEREEYPKKGNKKKEEVSKRGGKEMDQDEVSDEDDSDSEEKEEEESDDSVEEEAPLLKGKAKEGKTSKKSSAKDSSDDSDDSDEGSDSEGSEGSVDVEGEKLAINMMKKDKEFQNLFKQLKEASRDVAGGKGGGEDDDSEDEVDEDYNENQDDSEDDGSDGSEDDEGEDESEKMPKQKPSSSAPARRSSGSGSGSKRRLSIQALRQKNKKQK